MGARARDGGAGTLRADSVEVAEEPMLPIGADGVLELLRRGRIEVEGRLVDASNATLFCGIALDGVTAQCVYKPVRGERPLWDFPDGTLAGREVATFLVSEAAGVHLVPPTVLREGPFENIWIQPAAGDAGGATQVGGADRRAIGAERDAADGFPAAIGLSNPHGCTVR